MNCELTKEQVVGYVQQYGSPLYIFHAEEFRKNYLDLLNTMRAIYPKYNIAYSYKTNYTPKIISLVKELGGLAEVVSEMEYTLAKRVGYGIGEDKKVILGVASVWDRRKGLEDFLKLSKLLDEEYKIVLIGLNKKQIVKLPNNVLGIERTENIQELVAWYSAADVFVNPTYEDNYPTTNLEAIACGTPVITYDTGGSPESACCFGAVATKKDSDSIIKLLNTKFQHSKCNLSYLETVKEYCELYHEIN